MTSLAARLPQTRTLRPIFLGSAIGAVVVLGNRVGLWQAAVDGVLHGVGVVHWLVGPVWVPMLLVSLRVGWISVRAFRTRSGRGSLGVPSRPELGQLAPLFAALGLCGTVWGLLSSFEALEQGTFLTQLPKLLGGLGAAMTSTLVGLGLQIATLLLAIVNPSWSWARIGWVGGKATFELDGRPARYTEDSHPPDASGLRWLVGAVLSRQPEALCVEFVGEIPGPERARIRDSLWRRLDSGIRVRVLGS